MCITTNMLKKYVYDKVLERKDGRKALASAMLDRPQDLHKIIDQFTKETLDEVQRRDTSSDGEFPDDQELVDWIKKFSSVKSAQFSLDETLKAQRRLDRGKFVVDDTTGWDANCEQMAIDHDTSRLRAVIAHHKRVERNTTVEN